MPLITQRANTAGCPAFGCAHRIPALCGLLRIISNADADMVMSKDSGKHRGILEYIAGIATVAAEPGGEAAEKVVVRFELAERRWEGIKHNSPCAARSCAAYVR